ncbi:MAG: hypothetical protein BWX47_01890 [candidate division Hyd24-12 bacterium ADurb.Bin004]|nr:MAG: hypothetical protein BWX47_01890 [candidate division Hyd24-12 bacterium ADurb.Bin004]
MSSSSTSPAASRATSVPRAPIATPMSAAFRAGASFTPSPVIATVSPALLSASTTLSFCLGTALANTETSGTTLISSSSESLSSSAPVSIAPSPRPSFDATSIAVAG